MAKLIFDYDGTLHQTIGIYAPALRQAYANLVAAGCAPMRNMSDEEISQWLGWSTVDMWNAFMPDLPEDMKRKAGLEVGQNMYNLISGGKAKMYPGALDVLQQLKNEGHTLICLSNCDSSYRVAHIKAFGLEQNIDSFYATGDYNYEPKTKLFEYIQERYGSHEDVRYIAIGDRFYDIELADSGGLDSIGCLYGYGRAGELDTATIKVTDVTQIPSAVKQLMHL